MICQKVLQKIFVHCLMLACKLAIMAIKILFFYYFRSWSIQMILVAIWRQCRCLLWRRKLPLLHLPLLHWDWKDFILFPKIMGNHMAAAEEDFPLSNHLMNNNTMSLIILVIHFVLVVVKNVQDIPENLQWHQIKAKVP